LPGTTVPAAEPSEPPGPVSNIPPPSTDTGAPDLSPARPGIKVQPLDQGVTKTLSAFGEALPDSKEAFRPKDELPDEELAVEEYKGADLDQATIEKILRYVGSERRDSLFKEIHELHDKVSQELQGNKTDVSFALETLREANNFVIERPYEYDEALYRVALVKTMLNRRRTLSRSSYRLGIAILFYGIIFTVLCVMGYFVPIDFVDLLGSQDLGDVFKAVWFSGLAGGLGGSVEIFWRLYFRVSVKQDFDPQYTMYYLVKPILGFVLGLVMYFLIAVGSAIMGAQELPQAGTTTGFTLSILLGFVAGYRQESVFDMIYVLVKRISPEAAGGGAKSVVPVEQVTSKSADGSGSVEQPAGSSS
jgi:hypothetical protein